MTLSRACEHREQKLHDPGEMSGVARDPAAIARTVNALRARFDNRGSEGRAIREQHGNLTSWHPVQTPDAVFFPQSTEEVSEAVRICAEHRTPIIPFGVGTSLEAGVNAPFGGVCFDMGKMAEVLIVHEEDMDCVVQPGVTRKQLNSHLRASGLFFPIDPGAD